MSTGITPKEFIDNNPLRLYIHVNYVKAVRELLWELSSGELKFNLSEKKNNGDVEFIINATDSDFAMTYYRVAVAMFYKWQTNLDKVFSHPDNIIKL